MRVLIAWLTAASLMAASPLVEDDRIVELSGIAESRANPGILWCHNDSGNLPWLYAIDQQGAVVASIDPGIPALDLEDIACATWQGQHLIALGDIGDNGAMIPLRTIHLFTDPVLALKPGHIKQAPLRSITFCYAGGPRDCEALAIDGAEGAIYLLTKATATCALYKLNLASQDSVQIAQRLTGVSLGTKAHHRVTALDISPDGRQLLALTPGGVYLAARSEGESWTSAIANFGEPLRWHETIRLHQPESACFLSDGTIVVSSEGPQPPLLHLSQENPAATP